MPVGDENKFVFIPFVARHSSNWNNQINRADTASCVLIIEGLPKYTTDTMNIVESKNCKTTINDTSKLI